MDIKEQSLELAVLHRISHVLVRQKNISELLKEVLDILYTEMGLERGTFTLKRGDYLVIEASHGLTSEEVRRGKYKIGEGITGKVALTGKPVVIPDISKEKAFLDRTKARSRHGKKVAFICVPIIHRDAVIGTMSIDRNVKEKRSLRKDLHLLEIVANILADALAENLVEAELFGHEKGAFTGAIAQRKGRCELAEGGTLFLDEIGDINLAVQVKLLRFLQEKTFERVGGQHTLHVEVRVIAATSKNLEEEMTQKRFREDLYYRLNVFPIHLPPLRERRSDIVLLADFFLEKYNKIYNKNIKRISTPAINMMTAYHWPGNVREFENCIERAVLTTTDDVIHGYNLPPSLQTAQATNTMLLPEQGASLEVMVASYEREIIVDALKVHKGNVAEVAKYLRSTPRIIHYKIKKLNIDPKKYKYSSQ